MSGDGYGSMIGDIFDGVSQAIEDINEQSRENIRVAAQDPCYAEIELVAFRRNVIDPAVNNALSNVNSAAGAGRQAVYNAKAQWGRAGRGAGYLDGSVTPFAEGLIDSGVIPRNKINLIGWLFGSFVGLAIADQGAQGWVDDHLPPSGSAPSNKNRGLRVAPGAYLYAGPNRSDPYNAEHGVWTGSRVRAAYNGWLEDVRRNAAPAGHNAWRDALRELVGEHRDDWTVWREGDPVAPGSRLGFLLQRRQEVTDQAYEYADLCALQREREHGVVENVLETARLQALAPYVAGSLLALAWILGRKRA